MVQYKKEALNIYIFFSIKFNNIRLNKKEFRKSKQPIDLMAVSLDQIGVSDKFKHNNEGFNISLVTKKVKLSNRYVSFYHK